MAASATSLEYVQKMFLAYFGRPVAPTGQEYYAQLVDAGNIAALQDDFWNSAESQAKFGSLTTEGKVNAIFNQLFGRDAAVSGLTYWTTEINAGRVSLPVAALTILNSASAADLEVFNAKLDVANAFTAELDTTAEILAYQSNLDAAVALLAGVKTAADADAVIADISNAVADVVAGGTTNPGQTFTLTTGADTITGTTGNDTIIAVDDGTTGATQTDTFTNLDVIDGGAGTDTIELTNANGTMTLNTAVTVKNVEKAVLTSAQNAVTADVSGWTGLEEVTVNQLGTAAAIAVTTKANVETVTVSKGTTVAITDSNTTAGADKLASVSLDGNTGAATLTSDALTSLSLANLATVAAVANTTVGHTLDVTANKLAAGAGVTDAVATTVNVTATGANSTGVTLTTDAATAVTIAGDKNISMALVDAGANAAVVTSVTSTNTGTVTITSALGNTTAFTGGAGKETITINNLNTKAIAMGAGDDKVNVTGTVLGANGTIDGGDGTDTLAMSAADAEALSLTATYEARISNFEKVSLGAAAEGQTDTVNLANLDDISYVVSAGTDAGTAAGGTAEVATVTFSGLKVGQSVTVGAQTYTNNTAADMTGAQVATAFAAATAISDGTGNYTESVSGADVTYTASVVGDVADLTASVANSTVTDLAVAATTDGVAAVAAATEVFTVAFSGFATGADTITFDGTPITLTDADNANLIATAVAAGGYANWTAVNNGDGTVTFTNKTAGDVTDVQASDFVVADVGAAGRPVVASVTIDTQGVTAVVGSTETTDVSFTALKSGQSVVVAGRTVTANGADLTAAQVEAAFLAGVNSGNAVVGGTLAGWTVAQDAGGPDNSILTFTSATANTDVADIDAGVAGTYGVSAAAAATVPSVSVVDGTATGAGGALVLTNVANAGTFELTGNNNGSVTVTMKDATGTADSLNLKLNGLTNLVGGVVNVAGVESIAIVATDSVADDVTVTNPTAVSTLALNAAAATSITLTGNHGVDFTGSTLTKVTSLDASGVTANVNTTGLTAAQIVAANGVAGAVTFTTVVTDKDVTITTGNGDDVINASSVGTAVGATKSATITTGAGADTIFGGADNDVINAGSERDTVNSSTGADTITLGSGNDVYVLGTSTDSVLAKYDTLTDFSANTYGQGASGAATSAGATATVASLTGDVIDLSSVIGGGVTGIDVFVVSNAADAQTFIQNTADAGTLTGIALDSSSNLLYIDLDSNGSVDSVIKLTGVTTIDEAAFAI